ncbi:glycoside hydrolase family 73 protein, partial [Negativicoccus succinicivorans]|uniref:glycoside hydrolase family 73 protein n=1 Tax=Negativicoccus succinicivorans TaxID=620903 RepID=UPI0023A86456
MNQLAPYARLMQEKYGVIASISIAQAILESDWHTSTLSTQYNNLFGIKADAGQKSVVLPTQEFQNGEWVTIQGRFAAYDSWQESMKAHAELLYHGTSWNAAQYQHVLAAKDYQAAANALTKDGY